MWRYLELNFRVLQIKFNRLLKILTEICNDDQIVSMVNNLESYSGCNEYHCHSSLNQLSSIQFHGKLTDNKLNVHWLHFILHSAQIPKRLSFWPWLLLLPWLLHSLFCNHLGLNWNVEEFTLNFIHCCKLKKVKRMSFSHLFLILNQTLTKNHAREMYH